MGIADLTNQLKALGEYGVADLEFSESARDAYLGIVEDFRTQLQNGRDSAAQLGDLTNCLDYPSALETETRLELNVFGLDGLLTTLDDYIAYLDEFEATINAAFNRMQADEQA